MCPHPTIYVSSYYYKRVFLILYIFSHTTIYVPSYYNMCPHPTAYVTYADTYADVCWRMLRQYRWIYVSSYYNMCPHPTAYVTYADTYTDVCWRMLTYATSVCVYICVLILQFVLILFHMCSHTTICVLMHAIFMRPHVYTHICSMYEDTY